MADLADASTPTPPSIVSPASAYTYGPHTARRPELEVLLTDGRGGFAMSSLAGVPTRRSSGLVVSHNPPLDRISHMISPLEILSVSGEEVALHALELAPNVFEGHGLDLLTGATIWDLLPEREQLWRGVQIRRRSFMTQHTGSVTYKYDVQCRQQVSLILGGFFVDRNFDQLHQQAPPLVFETSHKRVRVNGKNNTRVTVRLPRASQIDGKLPDVQIQSLNPAPFSQRVYYRADAATGAPAVEYVRGCAFWRVSFPAGGGSVAITVQGVTSDSASTVRDPWEDYFTEVARRRQLAERAWQATGINDELVATLAVAADSYLVQSGADGNKNTLPARSIIVGYPHLTDGGREAMMSLTGLTLVTGRPDETRAIIDNFNKHLDNGLLPNHYDETSKEAQQPTADGALWLIVAVERYARTTGDGQFTRRLLPTVREILSWYVQGTGKINMESDGLLKLPDEGNPMSWMNVQAHDWIVTRRAGKPIEIQALWLAALGAEKRLSEALGEKPMFEGVLLQSREQFDQFWQEIDPTQLPQDDVSLREILGIPADGYVTTTDSTEVVALEDLEDSVKPKIQAGQTSFLFDVLAPNDSSIRPNSVLAISLPDTPAENKQVDAIIAQTEAHLLTPMGLRSLSPLHPSYQGEFSGSSPLRDTAVHQGAVWPWTIGAYVELLLSRGDVRRARAALSGLIGHVWEGGIGHVSEMFSGDSFTSAGCPFYAASVAELLRVHVLVSLSEIELGKIER